MHKWPSQTWYLIACSKGMFRTRKRLEPLEIGKNKNDKQNAPANPNPRADHLKNHDLKSSNSILIINLTFLLLN